jgi:hypothetical protein
MRSRKTIALAMTLVVVASTLLGTIQAAGPVDAQFQNIVDDPALFDLDVAQAELDSLRLDSDRLIAELASVLGAVDGLTIERDFIELNDQARNDVMQQSRTQARNMAINAYIGIGPPLSGLVVFDAKSANDLSFRNGLLRQQAERLQEAAQTYSVLAGEANDNVLELGDSINDEIRVSEALSRSLARTVEQIPHAKWIVSIAEIHRLADDSFVESGRSEPTTEEWRKLRFCESTETYNIDNGNTFYGAYQFTWETWGTVGGAENPAHSPPAEQDARARLLYARRGSQPWPVCGRFLP